VELVYLPAFLERKNLAQRGTATATMTAAAAAAATLYIVVVTTAAAGSVTARGLSWCAALGPPRLAACHGMQLLARRGSQLVMACSSWLVVARGLSWHAALGLSPALGLSWRAYGMT
jgi:hypothetical protein